MVQTTAATHPSKGEGFPQTSPCRADPSQDVLDLMATMDLNFGEGGSGASAGGTAHAKQNQNANPNHQAGGKKSKWRKKLDRVADQQTMVAAAGGKGTAAVAVGGGGGAGHTNGEFAFYGVQPERKAQKKKGKKKLPKKSVIVEISSPPVLPPGAYAAEGDGTSPASSNDKRGHGKKKKSKAKKGGRKNLNGGDDAEEDFSTKAGGAAVLAALGQYPWVGVYPNAVGVDHDGWSPVSTPTMEGGQEGGYQMPYDPNAYAAYGQPYYGGMPYYPHVEATQQQPGQQPGGQQPAASSGTVMMPAGYYVPVFYGQQQGGPQPAVEYQHPVQYPVYYPQPGYAPYGAVPAEQYSAGSNVGGTHSAPSTPLNVNAPAFNPKGFEG